MKHLSEYAFEALIYERKGQELSPVLMKMFVNKIKSLGSDDSLEDYVDDLNAMLKDKDAKQILDKAFIHAKKGYSFTGKIKNIPVKNLHPTQSEIDIDKSLGFPFKSEELAKLNGDKYYGNAPVKMPFPLITFNDRYILDGHHRWSQVYSFNPKAKMVCVDIQLAPDSDVKKVTANDALKICQGMLAAKRAEDKQGKIPKSKVGPGKVNVFEMDKDEIKAKVQTYIDKKDGKPAEQLADCAGLENKEQFLDLLTNNLMDLKDKNANFSEHGNSREVMPQMDKGGDDMDDTNSNHTSPSGSHTNSMDGTNSRNNMDDTNSSRNTMGCNNHSCMGRSPSSRSRLYKHRCRRRCRSYPYSSHRNSP